jgi:hypothetical protein
MSIIQFGTGVLFAVPNAGNMAANPTPYKLGILQEIAIDFKGDLKKLYGQYQFPVAKARGKIEVGGKAKFATLDPSMLNQLYFGQAQAAGMTILAVEETDSIPTTPFAVTVTNAAFFVTDYGVSFALTGVQLTKVASGTPTTGQYKVDAATGIYTFAAADTGLAVLISYTYTSASRGTSITLSNQLLGYAPEFRAFIFNNFRNKLFGLELYSCTMGAISIPTKQEDFWISDISWDAGVDASNTLGKLFSDLS